MFFDRGERIGLRKREGKDKPNQASPDDDVDGVLCPKGEGVLVVFVRVLVGERSVIESSFERGWERRKMGGRSLLLAAREKISAACAGREKTCGEGGGMWRPSVLAPAAGNSSSDEIAVRGAAVRHVER